MEQEKYNKYKEKYKRLLKDYEKLENQCRSLFDRNSHLMQEVRELEEINDELTEQLCSEGKKSVLNIVAEASDAMAKYRHELEDKENDSKRVD